MTASDRLAAALADRYRIDRELGAGGMATVYLAEDLKHGRRVAIKVLRPELAAVIGAERFVREIRTIAALQHPHILGLIDSGEVQGTAYYVMPFVQGESLRDRLNREKQLPIADAIRLSSEVAGALDYAHRHGVIHRDIKPENILLHDGTALVADFGIALAVSSAGGSTRMTETGMSLGTPHYMSPEQAMGEREITACSDVYALGCVTYEMLIGEPPFTGPTAQAIVAKMMTERPRSLVMQRATVPLELEAAVLTSLEKLPADRFASAADFAEALVRPGFTTTRTRALTAAAAAPRGSLKTGLPWAICALALAAAAWGWLRPTRAADDSRVLFTDITLPDSAPLAFIGAAPLAIGRTALVLSPDGGTLAYVAERAGGTELYLRPMDRDTVFPLPGTEGACCPFFSPDGKWLAFHAHDRLSKVRIGLPGSPIPITTVNGFLGGDWGDDGSILISEQQGRRAFRVNAETGAREPLRRMYSIARSLPGGRGILSRDPATLAPAVYVPKEEKPKPLGVPGTDLRYAPTGHMIYAHQGALWAVPFDLSRLETAGEPLAILPHLRSEASVGFAQYSFARSGLLAYASGGNGALSRLVVRRRSGQVDTLPFEPALFGCLSLSPDGQRIVTRIADPATGRLDVWMYDLNGGTPLRLTNSGDATCPSWSPDGRVTYVTHTGFESNILSQSATGRESATTMATLKLNLSGSAIRWHPDGRRVTVYTVGDSGNIDVVVVPLDSTDAVHPIANTQALEWGGIFSPDGHWIAYSSSESGADEIYVQPWPTTGHRWRVSRNGGEEPLWTKGGRALVYRNGQEWWSVDVTAAGQFTVSEPEPVARGPFLNIPGVEYAVSSDGERLYLLAPISGTATTTHVTVISNWFAMVRSLFRQASASGQAVAP
ncbi:MAG: protein kinase [Gemmatimonadales bacterium]|nr:protein kinase [Gemmatimonadales bacterium]